MTRRLPTSPERLLRSASALPPVVLLLGLLATMLASGGIAYAAFVATTSSSGRIEAAASFSQGGPQFREATSASTGTQTETNRIDVAAPATVDGDTLFAAVATSSANSAPSAPAGWSFYDELADSSIRTTIFRKTASGEPAKYTFSSSQNLRWTVGIVAYGNVASSDLKAGRVEEATSAPATHQTPSVTTTASTRLLAIYATGTQSTTVARTWTSSDFERLDTGTFANNGSNADVALSMHSSALLSAGTHQRSATASIGSNDATVWLIALT